MSHILVTGARAPVALHWARVLGSAGHVVTLADSHRFPLARATRFAAHYDRLPPPRGAVAAYARAVEALVREREIDCVLPTCEEIFFLAAARDLHGAAIPLLAPSFTTLAQVHDKYSFARLARGGGADPPCTTLIVDPAAMKEFRPRSRELVFKPVWSRFAERVLIRPEIRALDRIVPTRADPWVAQDYLHGEELCCWAMARQGAVRALQAYRPLWRAGQGAALAFEAVEDSAIERFVAGLCRALAWTGQISFDFRRDSDGALHAIECNPRATSGLHYFGSDLAATLLGSAQSRPIRAGAMTLPLAMLAYGLPQALRAGRPGAWLRDWRGMADLSRWPGDRGTLGAQFLALGEVAVQALRQRTSLKAAATADIEWNGEPLSPSTAPGASTIPSQDWPGCPPPSVAGRPE